MLSSANSLWRLVLYLALYVVMRFIGIHRVVNNSVRPTVADSDVLTCLTLFALATIEQTLSLSLS